MIQLKALRHRLAVTITAIAIAVFLGAIEDEWWG